MHNRFSWWQWSTQSDTNIVFQILLGNTKYKHSQSASPSTLWTVCYWEAQHVYCSHIQCKLYSLFITWNKCKQDYLLIPLKWWVVTTWVTYHQVEPHSHNMHLTASPTKDTKFMAIYIDLLVHPDIIHCIIFLSNTCSRLLAWAFERNISDNQ